jgi:hypothetical protein
MQGAFNTPVETPLPSAALGTVASQAHQFGSIFPAALRPAAVYTSDPMENSRHIGVRLFFNLTVVGGAGTLVAKVQVQDPASKAWMDLAGAVTASLAAIATTMLTIYPSVTVAANVAVATPLGQKWRVVATVGGNDVNFSVGGEYLAG